MDTRKQGDRALALIPREGTSRTFRFSGLNCLVRRHPVGHLNGYVQIPERHVHKIRALDSWEFDNFLTEIPANEEFYGPHGGITFSGKYRGLKGYWIGFDTAHFRDFVPRLDLPEELRDCWSQDQSTYKDMTFMLQELQGLAAAVAAWVQHEDQIDKDINEKAENAWLARFQRLEVPRG